MYLRRWYRTIKGQRTAYWALVESYRTERGPRQRVVAYLGAVDQPGRIGVKQAAQGKLADRQQHLFDESQARWVEVDIHRIQVEHPRDFGGPWLGLQLIKELNLDTFLERVMPAGREEIAWPMMSLVLVLSRLCDPRSTMIDFIARWTSCCRTSKPWKNTSKTAWVNCLTWNMTCFYMT